MRLSIIVHTLISRFLLCVIGVAYLVPFLIIQLIPKKWLYNNKIFSWLTYSFYWLVLKCTFLKITITGRENVPKDAAVIVANHQSSLDIPIVGHLLTDRSQLWLATQALRSSWVYRILLPKFVVWVDTSSAMRSMRALVQIMKLAKKTDQHVVVFPEGGRHTDGKIHDFYSGFAVIACRMQREVIPIFIKNLNKVYPPSSFWMYNYPVRVVIGKPMIHLQNETDKEFSDRVHKWFFEHNKQK